MTTHEFTAWPKTARLFRTVVVTEKLDGTNAAVHITEHPRDMTFADQYPDESYTRVVDGTRYVVTAQSRKRLITPDADNFGFARWVHDNAEGLVRTLGEGLHFGEWWGKGIQRGYGLDSRRFSLFNTAKWSDREPEVIGKFAGSPVLVDTVPTLYAGTFAEHAIRDTLNGLKRFGSVAAPGFTNPEGICVWHSQTRQVFKVTLDNNDAGKWETA